MILTITMISTTTSTTTTKATATTTKTGIASPAAAVFAVIATRNGPAADHYDYSE